MSSDDVLALNATDMLADGPNEFSALQLMAGRYRMLCDMALLLSRESDVERLADSVLDKITGLLDFDRCSVAILASSGHAYHLRTQSERREGLGLVDLPDVSIDRGIAGHAMRNRRVVYMPDTESIESSMGVVDGAMDDGVLRSVLSLPLTAQGHVVGALTLGAARPEAFSPSDIQMARQVASCLALAIERQRGREEAEALDRKLEDKAHRLEETVERLERTNLELDTFIYAASHDLRAPLLSVSGLTDLALMALEAGELGELREVLPRIQRNIKRLDQLVVDILQVSRARRLERRHEPVDLRHLVGEVLESLSGLEGAGEVDVRTEVAFEQDVPLEKLRVRQVVSNLLSNAIKYRDPSQAKSWVVFAATLLPGEILEIQVRDNGIGIPEDQRPHIFDLFYRGTNRSFGAGLGLYLVKQHVTAMHGEVSCRSESGLTVFELRLPVLT